MSSAELLALAPMIGVPLALFGLVAFIGIGQFPAAFLFGLFVARSFSDLAEGSKLAGLNPSSLIAVGFLGLFLIRTPLRGIVRSPVETAWLLFLAVGSVSLAWHFSIDALNSFAKLMAMWAVFALAFDVERKHPRRNFVEMAVLASGVVPMAVGFYQAVTGTGVVAHNQLLASHLSIHGTLVSPNSFAFLVSNCVAALWVLQKRMPRVVWLAVVALMGYLLWKSYTKLAWLAVLGMALAYFWMDANLRRRVAFLLFVGITAIFLQGEINRLPSRIQEDIVLYQEGRTEDIGSGRIGLWLANISGFSRYSLSEKLLGAGFETAHTHSMQGIGVALQPHNDFLRILVENGILGLSLWLLILFLLFRRLVLDRTNPERAQNFGFFLMGCTIYLADNSLFSAPVSWAFWALLGAKYARSLAVEKTAREASEPARQVKGQSRLPLEGV